ncbi:MAG: OmpA family, partial [Bacteroidota bacterium]
MSVTRFISVIILASCLQSALLFAREGDIRNAIAGTTSIRKGDSAVVSWSCADAIGVQQAGDTTILPANYTLSLRPASTVTLRFLVLRTSDTSSMTWSITVRPADTVKVQRGGEIRSFSLPPSVSMEPNTYYVGYNPQGVMSQVSSVKILRFDVPDSSRSEYVVYGALLDSLGNNIPQIPSDSLRSSLRFLCDGASPATPAQAFDSQWTRSQRHMIMTICMDRSAYAQSIDSALRSGISAFTFSLRSGDLLSVNTFNSDVQTVCPHSSKDRLNNLGEMFSGDASGLCAMLRAIHSCLQKFDATSGYDNLLVVISAGADNSSIAYDVDDLITKATAKRARIISIGVGDFADGYMLRFLASRTGGMYYSLTAERAGQITDILREINNGVHGAYTFRVPLKTPASGSCDDGRVVLEVGLQTGSRTGLRDTLHIVSAIERDLLRPQILCLFPYGRQDVSTSFMPHIRKLITLLRDNPGMLVELIGNCFAEGDEEAMRTLSEARLRSIRTILLDSGVAPTAIRCRAM